MAAPRHLLGQAKGDGKLTFDKLTDLYHSGTKHEEDQPSHLVIHDTNICNTRCVKEFGSPCQNFCPANVYEMVDDASAAEWQAHQPESFELRALQNLRHHGPLPDHHLGPARGRRRPELRWHVTRGLLRKCRKAEASTLPFVAERFSRRSLLTLPTARSASLRS